MLSQMREGRFIRTVLWIVVVAFVGTMVFVWGADLQGLDCSASAPQGQRWVGMVGDMGLSARDFDRRYRQGLNQLAQERQSGQVITEDERLRLLDQLFDQMVNEAVFALEAERLNLLPSDEEIAEVLQFDPPEFLKQQFYDQQGNFDRSSYEMALNNPNIDWRPLEQVVRNSLPSERLRQIVGTSVHVSEGDIRQEFERRFSKAQVLYTGLAWRDAVLEQEDPGDEVLQAHLAEHPENFEEPERLRIQVVQLSRDPSPADEAYVLGRILGLREQILKGQNFEDIARLHSEDPSNSEQGGDLGWFGRGRMVPDFELVAFALSDDEVSEPVRTQFGLHLIKREARREEGGGEEIHARHILLRIEPSYTTVDSMAALADTLYGSAKVLGSLEEATAFHNLEIISPKPFSERESIENLGYNSAIKAVSQRLEPGEVSQPFAARDADYIVQLLMRIEAHTGDFTELREDILQNWQQEEKKRIAREKAAEVRLLFDQEGLSIRQAGERLGLEVVETEEFTRRDYIPGVGSEGPFQILAFMLNHGDVSRVVETPQGAYVLEILKKIPSDKHLFTNEHDKIQQGLLAQIQQDYFQSWMDGLKNRYEVKDWRDQYFN